MEYTKEIDLKGQVSPFVVVNAMKEVETYAVKIRSGEINEEAVVLEFIIDHMPAVDSIPDAAENMGFECKVSEIQSGIWKIAVRLLKSDLV